jgi:hypothetical protein
MQRIQSAMSIALVAVTGVACATARIDSAQTVDRQLPRPGVVLIYDFAVTPEDAVADTFGSEFSRPANASKDVAEARKVADVLALETQKKLLAKGINAARADHTTIPPLHALLLKGEFVSMDKGSTLKRMVIGFGAGSTELHVRAQVYQATEHGLARISEAEASASGSKMPGMAVPVGAGAAAGRVATSAVVSGGMNVVKEIRSDLAADATRLADEIAGRAEAFYKRQGWL